MHLIKKRLVTLKKSWKVICKRFEKLLRSNIYNYESLLIESWQKSRYITFLIVLKSPEFIASWLLLLRSHPLSSNFDTNAKSCRLDSSIITKEEKRKVFVYSATSKHVTLCLLCKRCTFSGCHFVFVYWAIEILQIIHQSWLSAVFIFSVTTRQLHKDKPHENFIKVHFKSWAVKWLLP